MTSNHMGESVDEKPLIMLVDDDQEFLNQMVALIEHHGMRAKAYSDAKIFLGAIRANSPSVCLVDLEIAKANDGSAVIKAVKNVIGKDIPMIVLSGTSAKSPQQVLDETGADGFVPKPFDEQTLITLIQKLVSRGRNTKLTFNAIPHKLLSRVYAELMPHLSRLGTCLEIQDSVDHQVDFLADQLEPHRIGFLNMIGARHAEGHAGLTMAKAIRFFGLTQSRNLLLAFTMYESVHAEPVPWNEKTGKPEIHPKEFIDYSLRAVREFGDDSLFGHTALASGLVFDLLSQLMKLQNISPTRADEFFEEGIKRALKMIEWGKKTSEDIGMVESLVTVALLSEAGRLALALFEHTYFEHHAKFLKLEMPKTFQIVFEQERYQMGSHALAAVLSQYSDVTKESFMSLLFLDAPFVIDQPGLKKYAQLANLYLQTCDT